MNDNAVGRGKSTLSFDFDNHRLTIIEMDGTIYLIAKKVGKALGYADEGRALINKISGEWSSPEREGGPELRADTHFLKIEGERLSELRVVITDSVIANPKTRSLLLLTETGLWRVLILTGKPAGIRLRDRLDSEILPQLRKTGSYSVPGTQPPTHEHKKIATTNTLTIPKVISASMANVTSEEHMAYRHRRGIPQPKAPSPRELCMGRILAMIRGNSQAATMVEALAHIANRPIPTVSDSTAPWITHIAQAICLVRHMTDTELHEADAEISEQVMEQERSQPFPDRLVMEIHRHLPYLSEDILAEALVAIHRWKAGTARPLDSLGAQHG